MLKDECIFGLVYGWLVSICLPRIIFRWFRKSSVILIRYFYEERWELCLGKKKKLEYFIIYVNSGFSAFCLLRGREEVCVVGVGFVDVWGNWFF